MRRLTLAVLALPALLACGPTGPAAPPHPEAPRCPVPFPDEAASRADIVFSRREYHFTYRAYTYVTREGRLLHRADHAGHEGDACGEARLSEAEMRQLREATTGICHWPVLPAEAISDQGRIEYVMALDEESCTRSEASSTIVPISPANFATGEPLPPLPTWARLNQLLDRLVARARGRVR